MCRSRSHVQRIFLVLIDASAEDFVHHELVKFKKNSFLYVTSLHSEDLEWFQVITTKSGYAMNPVKFYPNSLKIDLRVFDLQGLKVTAIDLEWTPYVVR